MKHAYPVVTDTHYLFNAFRSLLGIASEVIAPTYAETYAAKSRTTTSSGYL